MTYAFPEKIRVGLTLVVDFTCGVSNDLPSILGISGVGFGDIGGYFDGDWLGGFGVEVNYGFAHFSHRSIFSVYVELVISKLVLPKNVALGIEEFIHCFGVGGVCAEIEIVVHGVGDRVF